MPEKEVKQKLPKRSFLSNFKNTFLGFFGLRQTKHGLNFGVLFISVLGILIILNAVFAKKIIQFDLTAKKVFSLSDKTKQVLERFNNKPIKAIYFYSNKMTGAKEETTDLLDSYKILYDKFSYELVNPDLDPALAKKYGIDRYGALVLVFEDRFETVNTIDEESVTNAFIKINSITFKKVCFLKGHNEFTIDNQYQSVRQILEKNNYKVNSIILLGQNAVPVDCNILVVPSSISGLQDSESQAIKTFLNQKGKAMFLVNPLDSNIYGSILSEWGVQVGNDIVVDVQSAYFGLLFDPVLQIYSTQAITSKLSEAVILHTSRSVGTSSEIPAGINVEWLVKTGQNSWAETDLVNLTKPKYDKNADQAGPISVAVLVKGNKDKSTVDKSENLKGETRLIVIGDTDFVTNDKIYRSLGNKDLFLNSINWLAEEEDIIAIPPKEKQNDPIILNSSQIKVIMGVTIAGMPLLVLLIGFVVWFKRRKG